MAAKEWEREGEKLGRDKDLHKKSSDLVHITLFYIVIFFFLHHIYENDVLWHFLDKSCSKIYSFFFVGHAKWPLWQGGYNVQDFFGSCECSMEMKNNPPTWVLDERKKAHSQEPYVFFFFFKFSSPFLYMFFVMRISNVFFVFLFIYLAIISL